MLLGFVKKYVNLDKVFEINTTRFIVMGFALVIFLGTILLTLPFASRSGESIGFLSALFTSTSAVCVTGLVVVDTYTHWTIFGQIVILFLIQIGGLGFMTMATMFSFALRRKISLKERLLIAESFNQYNLQGIVKLTRNVLLGTLIFEGIGAIILSFRFVPVFGLANGIYKGVFHSVSAFCNAGFDLMGQLDEFSSLTYFVNDTVANIVIMSLIIIGGVGFAVWDDLIRTRRYKEWHLHTKLVLSVTLVLLLSGFVFILFSEWNNINTLGTSDIKGKFLSAAFQSVTPRTAGFNTINIADMRYASIFVIIILMFIGGSSGSTAGGIKTTTIGILFFTVVSVIRGKHDTELFKRRVSHLTVMRAFTITFVSIILICTVIIILSLNQAASLIEVIFEAVSAFGTVGLSLGLTPELTAVSRIAIIVTMFFGRVGVLTMAIALVVKSMRTPLHYKYKEDKVMVG